MRTRRPLRFSLSIFTTALWTLALAVAPAAAAPEGTLTVAVATFGNERWLPNLTPGAEDVVLKPMFENLLTRDPKTGELAPMLAERWKQERVRIMRDEMGPWLHDYVPGVAIGAAHAIMGVGSKVGNWPLIPGHMGFHNWEYVTRR